MFKEMRRKDRMLDDKKAIEILKKSDYGVLSTVGVNGCPYGVPLNFVYLNNCIYFHCAMEGSKLDSIKNNKKVSFCVVGNIKNLPSQLSMAYESVIVFGEAGEVSAEEKFQALSALVEKYAPRFIKEGQEYIKKSFDSVKIIKINIKHLTGKARGE